MRTATVWHGKDGYLLRVEDVPGWAVLLDAVNSGLIGGWCRVTGGWGCPLCLCGRCGRAFAIGWGRDEDGLRRHSLGGFLFALGQRGGRFHLNRSRGTWERRLTFDEVCEHFPDCRIEGDDDGIDCVKGIPVDRSQEEYGVVS